MFYLLVGRSVCLSRFELGWHLGEDEWWWLVEYQLWKILLLTVEFISTMVFDRICVFGSHYGCSLWFSCHCLFMLFSCNNRLLYFHSLFYLLYIFVNRYFSYNINIRKLFTFVYISTLVLYKWAESCNSPHL